MLDFALSAFVTLLLVVDPVGLAPAFLAATAGMPDKVKRTIALRAPLIAASILVVIALVGNWLLRQLGIGIPAFQIAGGLLLFGVSYQMIFGDRPHREAREADKATSEHASDVAVFPLAIPMMAGPGAIATTLLLSGDAGYGARLAVIIAVVLSVCLLCMLCLGSPDRETLGRTGNAVLSRVLGMLLAAYSVQFVINGIAAVRTSLP
ncbi:MULTISPECIES: MarC family protein [Bradyrhizobium]|uniref:MarC family protein n=1 Tax=Bradyrhizobium TaxID=374 RepID=UPI0004BA9259|nr:MarC family protein [Bradyrhizobium sp. CCBAU 15544]